MQATVLEVLRRFLPAFLETAPVLSPSQHRALWALTHCRTAELGGHLFQCPHHGHLHFAFHSCNHKACPQCGARARGHWLQRQLAKRIHAPYFLVTFTLPSQLRSHFFGPHAKEFFDLFFQAGSSALSEKLATAKGFKAVVHGFMMVLHTWNQKLEFHPHLHGLVPGAGFNARGQPVRVKQADFLVYLPHLQAAFRQHLRRFMEQHQWQADPTVWTLDWGVHIQPVGSGIPALKYLAAYAARTAITDARILKLTEEAVTFGWKDRSDHNRAKELTLPGIEFVRRYLRHVLPKGLRSVRYYGFCHPAAKAKRLRLQFHTGLPVPFGAASAPVFPQPQRIPLCPQCGEPMRCILRFPAPGQARAPPRLPSSSSTWKAA